MKCFILLVLFLSASFGKTNDEEKSENLIEISKLKEFICFHMPDKIISTVDCEKYELNSIDELPVSFIDDDQSPISKFKPSQARPLRKILGQLNGLSDLEKQKLLCKDLSKEVIAILKVAFGLNCRKINGLSN